MDISFHPVGIVLGRTEGIDCDSTDQSYCYCNNDRSLDYYQNHSSGNSNSNSYSYIGIETLVLSHS